MLSGPSKSAIPIVQSIKTGMPTSEHLPDNHKCYAGETNQLRRRDAGISILSVTPIGWTFARQLFALLFDGTVPFVQSLFVKAGGSIQGRVILFLFRASSNHVSKRAGSYPIPASKISKEAREVMKSFRFFHFQKASHQLSHVWRPHLVSLFCRVSYLPLLLSLAPRLLGKD